MLGRIRSKIAHLLVNKEIEQLAGHCNSLTLWVSDLEVRISKLEEDVSDER